MILKAAISRYRPGSAIRFREVMRYELRAPTVDWAFWLITVPWNVIPLPIISAAKSAWREWNAPVQHKPIPGTMVAASELAALRTEVAELRLRAATGARVRAWLQKSEETYRLRPRQLRRCMLQAAEWLI